MLTKRVLLIVIVSIRIAIRGFAWREFILRCLFIAVIFIIVQVVSGSSMIEFQYDAIAIRIKLDSFWLCCYNFSIVTLYIELLFILVFRSIFPFIHIVNFIS